MLRGDLERFFLNRDKQQATSGHALLAVETHFVCDRSVVEHLIIGGCHSFVATRADRHYELHDIPRGKSNLPQLYTRQAHLQLGKVDKFFNAKAALRGRCRARERGLVFSASLIVEGFSKLCNTLL